jgi:hypothetical protein
MKIFKKVTSEEIGDKISFKDIFAVCIAIYEILGPVFIAFIIMFSAAFVLLVKYWMK